MFMSFLNYQQILLSGQKSNISKNLNSYAICYELVEVCIVFEKYAILGNENFSFRKVINGHRCLENTFCCITKEGMIEFSPFVVRKKHIILGHHKQFQLFYKDNLIF